MTDESGAPKRGRVVVFEPAEGGMHHTFRLHWQAAKPVLERHADPLDLEAVRAYFAELYWTKGEADKAFDAANVGPYPGILPAISESAGDLSFPFRSVAEAFRMIEDAMEPVVVPWKADAEDRDAEQLLARIASLDRPRRDDLRRLQQYVVPIPKPARDDWLARGVLTPVHPALGEAMLRFVDDAHYRPQTGVDLEDTTWRGAASNVIV